MRLPFPKFLNVSILALGLTVAATGAVAQDGASPAPEAAPEVRMGQTIDGPFFVTWAEATVRERPDAAAPAIRTVTFGEKLHVTGKVAMSDWLRVALPSGETGYVWAQVLAPMTIRLEARNPLGAGGAGIAGGDFAADDTIHLGLLGVDPIVLTGEVGPRNQTDEYAFVVEQAAHVTIVLDNLASDADLDLVDEQGQTVQSSALGGVESDVIETVIGPGLYTVRVSVFEGLTGYRLTLSADIQA